MTAPGTKGRRGLPAAWDGHARAVTAGAAVCIVAAGTPTAAAAQADAGRAATVAVATERGRTSASVARVDAAGDGHVPATVVAAVREYQRTGVARALRQGSFVTYPYRHSQPTLTCAPLRACLIELDEGERVWDRIAGDTERWQIAVAHAGPHGETPIVVVKPTDCNITTNLAITTSKGRIYHLTLDAVPCTRGTTNPQTAYATQVRYYYPDDLVAAWSRPVPPPPPPAVTVPASVERFNFDYRVQRDRGFPFEPVATFDDGARTFIKLPSSVRHLEAPVLFVLADDGSKVLLNYSVQGDTYVTDRVFRRAVMVVGDGGKERTLRLENRGASAGGLR